MTFRHKLARWLLVGASVGLVIGAVQQVWFYLSTIRPLGPGDSVFFSVGVPFTWLGMNESQDYGIALILAQLALWVLTGIIWATALALLTAAFQRLRPARWHREPFQPT